ncbi:MAG TPA: serine/threonine-protein kinase [Thermoanaerobaculia bacterium]|nr:serine/threonine-protein kinase [Thermoanaerobaculia bacterium]
MTVLPPGSRLGRFPIESVLGQGAMGVVYLAHDPQIDRPVALKTMRPALVEGEAQEVEARFMREAKLAGRLQHPNIVTVYDVGRDGDVVFIAMEYVDGRPLTRYIGANELTLKAKVSIVRQVAEALEHAHERGVVHRDIKPGNILIGRDGRVKVTDFGIGRFTSASTSDMTRAGQMIGSPAYMSPEQVRGDRLDGRSDLFSLGVVLYELLTAARPFPGESITTLVYQILHTEPRDPLELKSDLPPATREVMARLLAKQADKRPQNAHEFAQELRRIEKFQRESEMTRRAVVAAAAVPPPRPAAPRPAVPSRDASNEPTIATAPPTVASAPPSVPPPAPSPARASGSPRRSPVAAYLLLGAAIIVIAVLLLQRRSVAPAGAPAAAPTPAPVHEAAPPPPVPTAAAAEVPAAAAAPETLPTALPTPGPKEAASASVGVPRGTTLARTPRRAPTAAPVEDVVAAGPATAAAPPPPARSASGKPDRIDATYTTRKGVRFSSSPDQARLYVDGRYVGIADDWDNRGGGRTFEFDSDGTHYVRMELPGYQTRQIEIDVRPDARDSISIDDELERYSHAPYDKLSGVAAQTTGAVELQIEPADASVSEQGKFLGAASSFGASSPMRLKGPTVHDLVVSAPGYKPKTIRILVAPNAGKDVAKVSEKLKKE